MAIFYFDANAAVKYLHNEQGSVWVKNLVHVTDPNGEPSNVIYLATASITEGSAAFARLERTDQIGKTLRDTLYHSFLDQLERVFRLVEVDQKIFYHAARLAMQYPLRAYDAIQLAAALALQDQLRELGLELSFVTSDAQLIRAARAEGLRVENPESYPNP